MAEAEMKPVQQTVNQLPSVEQPPKDQSNDGGGDDDQRIKFRSNLRNEGGDDDQQIEFGSHLRNIIQPLQRP